MHDLKPNAFYCIRIFKTLKKVAYEIPQVHTVGRETSLCAHNAMETEETRVSPYSYWVIKMLDITYQAPKENDTYKSNNEWPQSNIRTTTSVMELFDIFGTIFEHTGQIIFVIVIVI